MTTVLSRRRMKGVAFVVDEDDKKKAVIIDLRRHRALWEDFYDALLTGERRNEPRETLEEVRNRVVGKR